MTRQYPYSGREYDRDPYSDRDYDRDRSGRRYGEESGGLYESSPRRHNEREREDRGWWDRTRDEVASWLGDEDAERRRRFEERGGWRGRETLERAKAADVMSRDVISVRPNDSIEYAARMMAECDCGALPVVDRGGRLIGMVTDRDITVRLVARGRDTRRARVADCMTDEVFSCHVFDSVEDCMQQMSRHQVRRLPIVDNRDRIVGIISQADLARYAESHRGHGERRAIADTLSEISEATDRAYR